MAVKGLFKKQSQKYTYKTEKHCICKGTCERMTEEVDELSECPNPKAKYKQFLKGE